MSAGYSISALEWQLLAFFEAEPAKLDVDIGWPYNTFIYQTCRGDMRVTFSVEPACKDFTLTVERNGVKQIELTALSVFDIRYHEGPGDELLEVLITQMCGFELRLKPAFNLTGSFVRPT